MHIPWPEAFGCCSESWSIGGWPGVRTKKTGVWGCLRCNKHPPSITVPASAGIILTQQDTEDNTCASLHHSPFPSWVHISLYMTKGHVIEIGIWKTKHLLERNRIVKKDTCSNKIILSPSAMSPAGGGSWGLEWFSHLSIKHRGIKQNVLILDRAEEGTVNHCLLQSGKRQKSKEGWYPALWFCAAVSILSLLFKLDMVWLPISWERFGWEHRAGSLWCLWFLTFFLLRNTLAAACFLPKPKPQNQMPFFQQVYESFLFLFIQNSF